MVWTGPQASRHLERVCCISKNAQVVDADAEESVPHTETLRRQVATASSYRRIPQHPAASGLRAHAKLRTPATLTICRLTALDPASCELRPCDEDRHGRVATDSDDSHSRQATQ